MSDDTTVPPVVPSGTDAHEALLRFQAAARLAHHGDRARALGIDPDAAALRLVGAGMTFLGGGG